MPDQYSSAGAWQGMAMMRASYERDIVLAGAFGTTCCREFGRSRDYSRSVISGKSGCANILQVA